MTFFLCHHRRAVCSHAPKPPMFFFFLFFSLRLIHEVEDSAAFRFVYYTERKPKNKKRGRPGDVGSRFACLWVPTGCADKVLNLQYFDGLQSTKQKKIWSGNKRIFVASNNFFFHLWCSLSARISCTLGVVSWSQTHSQDGSGSVGLYTVGEGEYTLNPPPPEPF